jgi:hypothetical protein
MSSTVSFIIFENLPFACLGLLANLLTFSCPLLKNYSPSVASEKRGLGVLRTGDAAG